MLLQHSNRRTPLLILQDCLLLLYYTKEVFNYTMTEKSLQMELVCVLLLIEVWWRWLCDYSVHTCAHWGYESLHICQSVSLSAHHSVIKINIWQTGNQSGLGPSQAIGKTAGWSYSGCFSFFITIHDICSTSWWSKSFQVRNSASR